MVVVLDLYRFEMHVFLQRCQDSAFGPSSGWWFRFLLPRNLSEANKKLTTIFPTRMSQEVSKRLVNGL